MKIKIRPRGMTLTKTQHVRLEHDLELLLARFGERIDCVIVALSDADVAGFKSCEIEVRIKQQHVKVAHSDTDVFAAVEHAARRAARAVGRAIETGALLRR